MLNGLFAYSCDYFEANYEELEAENQKLNYFTEFIVITLKAICKKKKKSKNNIYFSQLRIIISMRNKKNPFLKIL